MKTSHAFAIAALLSCASLGAAAQPSEHAADLAQTCLSCHGQDNFKVGSPAFSIPKLWGQRQKYLIAALNAYRSGERHDDMMTPQAEMLSDADVKEIAAYFAGPPFTPPGAPHGPDAMKTPQHVIDYCGACHTENGSGTMPEVAVIAGQNADYLEHALHAYRDGTRKMPTMIAYAKKLSDADIKELATYFGAQTGLEQNKKAGQ